MKSDPVVTINIPTYNHGDVLFKSVESALAQGYPHLAVHVLDDASTPDPTTSLEAKFGFTPQLSLYRNAFNLGRVKTYQRLVELSATEGWLINLDGDDTLSSASFVERGMRSLKALGFEAAFYQANHGNLARVKQLKSAIPLDDSTVVVDGLEYILNYHTISSFDHFATIYPAKLAKEIGFYEFNSLNTDFHSIMRLCKHGKVIVSDHKVGNWNLNSGSETLKIFKPENLKAYFAAVVDLANYYSNVLSPQQQKQLRLNLVSTTVQYLFYLALRQQNRAAAWQVVRQYEPAAYRKLFYRLKLLKLRFFH